ncbi:MAG: DUF885 family protein, partial [Kangiellaceae bacterium]|nr:DUF885 family protein [Kangiellaceae bacterium]
MNFVYKITFVSLCSFFLIACQNATTKESSLIDSDSSHLTSNSHDENEKLAYLVAKYSEELFAFSPINATFQGKREYNDKFTAPISQQSRTQRKDFEQKYLDRINQIDTNKLSEQSLLTYKIFKSSQQLSIESFQYPNHFTPINQMSGMHNFYAVLGSGQSAQPFNNEQDYRNFISRSKGFAVWMDSVINAMRQGIASKVVLPKSILKKLIPQLRTHMVNELSESVFYRPLNNLPEDLVGESRSKLIPDYEERIKETIIPAYRRLYNFLTTVYEH